MTEQEKTLIAGCVKGEKAAWDAFVLQYSGLVYHSIKKTFSFYHAEPGIELVEDLYQEFFVSILHGQFKKLRQFKGDRGCSVASWLRVVAARMTIDFLRRRGPACSPATNGMASSGSDPPEDLIERECEGLLLEAVQSLPPRDQVFLGLCYHQALPPQDIAGILKISVPAVYTQKSRILAKLRELLGKTRAL